MSTKPLTTLLIELCQETYKLDYSSTLEILLTRTRRLFNTAYAPFSANLALILEEVLTFL